ncbi:MAG: DUF1153 domain-containing protein [Caulobacteraceae bacterium]|nr:DUF1153 domain-containing protein [Caulobacteraceae bacterium]
MADDAVACSSFGIASASSTGAGQSRAARSYAPRPVADPWFQGLPLRGCLRWTPQRKASVARAIQIGLISFDDARLAYDLGQAELDGWVARFQRFGLEGLRVTKGGPRPSAPRTL